MWLFSFTMKYAIQYIDTFMLNAVILYPWVAFYHSKQHINKNNEEVELYI